MSRQVSHLAVLAFALAGSWMCGRAPAQSCSPTWMPGFGGNGPDGTVWCLAVFDDGGGGGPMLYVAGDFTAVGATSSVKRIARWNGSGWDKLGGGLTGQLYSYPLALAVYDDGLGGGPALYVGGHFMLAGGVAALRVAKWDGQQWSALGEGIAGDTFPWVGALCVFDGGSGPELYAGGKFKSAGGMPVNYIAKWDGLTWSKPGTTGLDGNVQAMAVFDDGLGGGPALYVVGNFSTADGVTVNHIARWNGTSWSDLGGGITGTVNALAVHDDGLGGGPALYAGGHITFAGGTPVKNIAKWDGIQWSALGAGIDGSVLALTSYDDGTGGGPRLYAGSTGGTGEIPFQPTPSIARWDGLAWTGLGSGVIGPTSPTSGHVSALLGVDASVAGGPGLFAGGNFVAASGVTSTNIARWACPDQPPGWFNLQAALAGSNGYKPELVGTGALTPGSPGTLKLSNARPSSLAQLCFSLSSIPSPFKGGTLLPVPTTVAVVTSTSATGATGQVDLGWSSWPAGLPAGSTLYFQYAVADPGAVNGVALSNTMLATTP